MGKFLTVLIAIMISSCKVPNIAELDEVSDLVFNKGYGEEEVLEIVNGVYYEDLAERWGEHGGLSGFWGDIWYIGNNNRMIVYYDNNGNVINVIIDEIKKDTGENNQEE